MSELSWLSIVSYCIFKFFLFYQQLHLKSFRGSSELSRFALAVFAFFGLITGFVYLLYYGWSVVWWAPVIIFAIGLLVNIAALKVERAINYIALSMIGFVVMPVSAFFMFWLVP